MTASARVGTLSQNGYGDCPWFQSNNPPDRIIGHTQFWQAVNQPINQSANQRFSVSAPRPANHQDQRPHTSLCKTTLRAKMQGHSPRMSHPSPHPKASLHNTSGSFDPNPSILSLVFSEVPPNESQACTTPVPMQKRKTV